MRANVGGFTALFVAVAAALASSAVAATPSTSVGSSAARPTRDQATAPGARAPAGSDAVRATQEPVTKLGTIVVTATRRSEALQKVPMPVSVVTSLQLQREHLQDFMDYAAVVPGLNVVSAGPGQTELSIRGIASGSQQPGASVGVYIDNTPFGSSSVFAQGSLLTPDLDPADLQRIEVLRGPQGTLYGAGALGGVIRFITVPPDTENYSGRLQVGGTSVDGGGTGFGVHGMVNMPLVAGKLALRANVYDTLDPGFIDDAGLGKTGVNESRRKGGRASLLWTPTDKTSLRITALEQSLGVDGGQTEALDPSTLRPIYGDLQQRAAAGSGRFNARYSLFNATVKTDLGWATLMSSSSWSTLDAVEVQDVTPLLFLGPQADGKPYGTLEAQSIPQTKATEEIRLTSPSSQRVQWLVGVFATRETGNNAQNIYPSDYFSGTPLPSPLGMPIGIDSQPSTYEEGAVYGSVTWRVTDRFSVETGLRYSHDRQHYTETGQGLLFGSPTTITLLDKRSSDSTTTFSVAPKFQIDPDNMVYARVASGFLPGGPNVVTVAIPGVPQTFSPTKLTDYELGWKWNALDDRFMTDLSAYYIDWTSIPLVTFINPFTFLGNGGQATSKGLEATVGFIPVKGLTLSFDASYNDATLSKDAPAPSNGRDGDPLPYAPKLTVGLNADYEFVLGDNWHAYVGGTFHHIGSRMTDFAFDTNARSPSLPGYSTFDLRAGVSRDKWTLSAYVKNLTNQRGIVLGSTYTAGTTVAGSLNPVTGQIEDNVTIITPRLFGISVSRDF